jgi:predicted nucleic acid-binding protein
VEKVLADTSAWVASFSKFGHQPLKETMKQKILSGELVITGMVLLELLQGTRDEKDYEALKKKLEILPFLSVDDSVWNHVARFSLTLRGKGQVVSVPDIFISHVALANDCVLLHCDSDFERIAKHSSLKTLPFL